MNIRYLMGWLGDLTGVHFFASDGETPIAQRLKVIVGDGLTATDEPSNEAIRLTVQDYLSPVDVVTTDETPTTLTTLETDDLAPRVYELIVSTFDEDANTRVQFYRVAVKQVAGAAAWVDAEPVAYENIEDAGASWTSAVAFDLVDDTIEVTGTGEADTSLTWSTRVRRLV